VSSEAVRSENLVELLKMAATVSGNMFRGFAGSDHQYKDFTTGQRWKTWALNAATIYPIGLGSFIVMKDWVGGSIMLGALATFVIYTSVEPKREGGNMVIEGVTYVVSAHVFNIVRSATYHKPKPKSSANAANFKPYDGLKLTILPTESGDYKVYARYDYTF
jgi:hypothetical protein